MKRYLRAVYEGDAPSRRCCRLLVFFLMVVITCLSFVPGSALASSMAYAGSPTLQVSAGFGTYFRVGAWVPLYITLHNNGPDFNGMLATSNPEGLVWQDTYSMVPSSIYQQPVTVARETQKQVTLYLPITARSTTVSIIVQLLDNY